MPTQHISRLSINTDGAIQHKALGTLQASPKPDTAELNGWDMDWLRYVDNPENLGFRTRGPYTSPASRKPWTRCVRVLSPVNRGQLILPCGAGKTSGIGNHPNAWFADNPVLGTAFGALSHCFRGVGVHHLQPVSCTDIGFRMANPAP
ncbi:MAG: hypothetical protein OXH72_01665 [Caldilineaceae bacterium]|nr:hypothetical protein [Caldilineaceae bacterium]MYC63542.1 hypothetical protein [Caldilineaceae bacterium SB0661_bin_34]